MANNLVIVPSDGDGFVELARTKQGRLFRKHILNKGKLTHPDVGEITIDDKFVKSLQDNFANGVCDIVQVPLAGPKNEHSEAPERNIGEVIGIEEKDDKVYVVLDARDDTHADKLGKTLLGASAMLALDYTDTRTNQKVGPTLLHTCVTNRPFVTGLETYEEVLAATSDTSEGAVLLTTTGTVDVQAPEENTMSDAPKVETPPPVKPSLEELLSALKTDHNIDVPALQAKAGEGEQAAALSTALVEALNTSGIVKLAAPGADTTTVSNEDVVGAVAELAQTNVTLTDRVNRLERQDAEHAVDGLITEGKIMPAQKKAYVELKLTNPQMFKDLVPDQPILKLNNEDGVNPKDDAAQQKNIDAEVARLTASFAGK